MRRRIIVRVGLSLALVLGVFVVGTTGYMLITGMDFIDALYMTVITVGTVGFREVVPLTVAGKIFTIALILAGVGALGFSFGTFVDFLVEGHLRGILEERTMQKLIGSFDEHHIVCGMGRVGTEVCRRLDEAGTPFVVLDKDEECVERARNEGWAIVLGDAAEEENLRAAGIDRARSLIAALDSDADNVYVTLTARTIAPRLFIVARATEASSEHKLVKAGANRVLTPTVIGGRRMASMVLHPLVTDYLDLVSRGGSGFEFRLEELALPEGASVVGLQLREAHLRAKFGVFVLAVQRTDGSVDAQPSGDTRLEAGDILILLGQSTQLDALAKAL